MFSLSIFASLSHTLASQLGEAPATFVHRFSTSVPAPGPNLETRSGLPPRWSRRAGLHDALRYVVTSWQLWSTTGRS